MTSHPLPAYAPTLDEAERATAAYDFLPQNVDLEELRALHQCRLAQAWQAAAQGARARSAFLSEMDHDLRTPLNAIIGYSEMLLEGAEASLAADLQVILHSGERLLGLLDHVLDLSRADARKLVFAPEPFDPCEAAAELADAAQPLAALQGNALEVSCLPMGRVLADAPKIRQVLYSLLENACKFTQRGHITLRVLRDGLTHLRLEVSDDGVGMDARAAADLFKGFERLHGGAGMGLASARKLCQVMGGTISVRSATGQGSRFTVILPVTAAD